jgi:immunoglobulin-like protein involved in spore germination/sporulation and spore germination protein
MPVVPARPLAAALVAAGLLATALGGCSGAPPDPVPVPTISAGPPTAPPTPPAPAPAVPRAVPVYYVVPDTPAGPRLYREFHQLTTADPATDAVREMLAEHTGRDPDYRSYWTPGTALRGPVTATGGRITVDLTAVGAGPPDPALAAPTVQQLVFTAQAALQSVDPVRILVEGRAVDQLWGVPTAQPVRRQDALDVRSPVQIDEPAEGATVGRDVEVTGEAAVFEATVLWQVLRGDKVVQSGATSTAEGQKFSPYRFTVRLGRGEYTVRVSEEDPSDGEGRPSLTDDKTITVT